MQRYSAGPRLAALFVFGTLLASAGAAVAVDAIPDTHHDDWRDAPRQQIEPAWSAPANLAGEELARAFLADRAASYDLAAGAADLVLDRVQESLLGSHYHFSQVLDGLSVEHGEVIVSLAKTDGRVYRAWNNYYPVPEGTARPAGLLAAESAYEIAWQRLRARGELLAAPRAELVWAAGATGFQTIWKVGLDLDTPYGAWELRLDAASGQVLALRDANIYRREDDFTISSVDERIGALGGSLEDRGKAFQRYAAKAAMIEDRGAGDRADGTGVIFDPDPRATLSNSALQDNSPPSSFTAAYFTRDLLDLTFSGGLYRVTGPWVNIINWDPPNTPPSTTSDGNWTAVRGDNAFNDAMTYYMLDTNQRYMQAMGFTGATGIQQGSIGTDTDGFNGADNSFYSPGSNRISFGHGCVDDSEDSDVMLHEYGHAIHYGINSNWNGGDTGAMGEGFGDYWAGSYSYSTPNGQTFHPEWVFSWDGHGDGNQCWSGRLLNKLNLVYNHNIYYGAHQGIPGGSSDELWSTPLFQSLIALMDLGQTRESVDQIILESHFGIGYGPKMRDLANATVAAAQALQPGNPHSGVFILKFAHHNIIEDLTAAPGDGDSAALPAGIRLGQNAPNPFNPKTEIRFRLPEGGAAVSLSVFDVSGRSVKTLAQGHLAGGEHVVNWDGTDHAGESLGSGVYFYRLSAAGGQETRKMLLLK